jgi:hypothetical protein
MTAALDWRPGGRGEAECWGPPRMWVVWSGHDYIVHAQGEGGVARAPTLSGAKRVATRWARRHAAEEEKRRAAGKALTEWMLSDWPGDGPEEEVST